MFDPLWLVIFGFLLITMVVAAALFARVLLTNAMIYLVVGFALGPGGFGLIVLDPIAQADVVANVSGAALLISLFSVGLKLGSVPMSDRRWFLPLRLASISMMLTVALIATAAVWWLGMSVGGAILLGAILAPTDPVLAAGVQPEPHTVTGVLHLSLSGEGALNDGTAFPFVLLGLGFLGLVDLGVGNWHWWTVGVVWGTVGGVAIGSALGMLIGKFVVFLRTRHQQAVGLNEFLSLGLVAIAYGVAQLCVASGFLAVFAAGLALQRVKERPRPNTFGLVKGSTAKERATHSHHASAAMTDAVQEFNEQLEKLAELAIVLLVGVMLPYAEPFAALWWFIPFLFIVARALAVVVGTARTTLNPRQRAMISWLGIRGVGSVFYVSFAISQGVSGPLAQQLTTATLVTVAASIVVHGISVPLLMRLYRRGDPVSVPEILAGSFRKLWRVGSRRQRGPWQHVGSASKGHRVG